ncbi:hypothetical protein A9Q78_02105 [Methylophaga sp. 41_12_T18]|nr:hypothetical protein A9Q78_02105 [Methylophaga sp. 41_12_T18]
MKNRPRTHRADSLNLLEELLAASLEQLNYRDYKIISQQAVILASGSGHDRGDSLPVELEHNVSLAWRGIPQVSRSIAATRAWKDMDGWIVDTLPTMMSFAAIVDNKGDTIALLAFEFDPDEIFNPLFHHSWAGSRGGTYGIDHDGLLLTHLERGQQLQQIGLLNDGPSAHSAFQLTMTDPGINLLTEHTDLESVEFGQPLTKMAQAIQQGVDGSNVSGYRDYRGVPVIGAWRWDDELQMAIVTEVDKEDAFYLFNNIVKIVFAGVISIIIVIFAATVFYIRTTRKTQQIQQQRDAVFNQTLDGIITIDAQGKIILANPAITAIFGYEKEALIGQNVSMLMPEHERSAHDDYLKNSTLHEPVILNNSRELRGCRQDGGHFPLELTVSPMLLDDGKYYVGVLRDVTERYQHHQDLISAKIEAENAKDIAENANRAKSEFLSKMSHELRTPLNAILGFSQLLTIEPLTDDQAESVILINDAGKHLLNLINDVLDLARIESGKMTVSLESVNVTDLIADIVPVIETQLSNLNLRLTLDSFSAQDVWVQADYLRLKQVLLNLLSNAVKYNRPKGFIVIDIRRKDNDIIRISIKDGGDGIESELQSTLFEPFNRLDKEDSEIQGTGIGLVISNELVKLMNGTLGLNSILGIGSTFWVELPFVEQSNDEPVADSESLLLSDSEMEQQQPQQQTKILYIEDNPANMTLVRQFFARYPGYQLLEAESAEAGLEMVRAEMPKLILMDINLPEMDGFEALSILKKEGLTKQIKVVALSANALVSEVERGHEAGFDDYLTKPIDFSKLLTTLNKVLQVN